MHYRITGTPGNFSRTLIHLAALFSVALASSSGQQTFTKSPDTMGTIIQNSAQNILSGCQSWPPKLAKNQKDQASGKNLEDKTNVLTSQLTGTVFKLDSSIHPSEYDASFLRLLDSVGTSDPAVSDDRLLGLAQLANPTQLSLWGTDLVIVKYDCMSMLSLLAQANASYSIPLFSLNAAFQANSGLSSNQTSVFMMGLFQSPFDTFFSAQDQPQQKIYAGLKAVDWRIRTNNTGTAQYISSGHFLTVTKTTANSQTLSIVGNFKGGVQIPFVQLSGSVGGQLSSSLQTDASSYLTYFWGEIMQSLPDYAALSSSVANSLPPFVTDTNAVSPGATVSAKTTILGWPTGLCVANAWKAVAQNSNYTAGQVVMTPSTQANSLPSCNITIQTSLAAAPAGSVADPGLALQHSNSAQVTIPLHLSGALHQAGKPSVTVISPQAGWTVQKDPQSGQKTFLQWSFPLHVQVTDGRTIQSITARRANFSCKPQDVTQTSWEITDAQIAGTAPPGPTRTGNSPDLTINALLTLQGTHQYNDDVTAPDKKKCAIYGSIDVASVDPQSGIQQTDTIEFQTADMFYPNDLPTTKPSTPASVSTVSGNTQVSLTWKDSTGAVSYNVYRAVPPSAPVQVKTGITKPSYQDTGLTNGTTYSYTVTALNAAGESDPSTPVNGTPLVPPAPPINFIVAGTANGAITLSWTASVGATAYNVYRSTVAGGETRLPGSVNATTFTDSGLTNGTTYFYLVKAVNSAGEGNASGEVSGVPKQ